MIDILQCFRDPRLFGAAIKDTATYAAWFAFLAALFALGMTPEQFETFKVCTGRSDIPLKPFREAHLVCGRRAGKSFMMAAIAVYLACFKDYAAYLGPGERATVMVIAADRRQARVIMRYVRGLLAVPALAPLIEGESTDSVNLSNRVTIEVGTASNRTTRGYTLAAAIADELAYWPQEDSATPDVEILAALRPAMATIPGAVLICASSPYGRRGALWEAYKRYFGSTDPNVLVWKAPTLTMNPSVPADVVADAYEADPANAAAEYGAEFRTDVDSFVSREAAEACIEPGVFERAPLSSIRYHGFVDPSGGSADSFTLAISHKEKDAILIDAVREVKPPFSPEATVNEFCGLLKSYRIRTVRGDRYAGEWPREQFRKNGVSYEPSEKSKSELYGETLPLINSRRAVLLDDKRMLSQLVGLERRVARGGRDSIDHAPNGHDDRINAIAGALVAASTMRGPMKISDEAVRGAMRAPGMGERAAAQIARMEFQKMYGF